MKKRALLLVFLFFCNLHSARAYTVKKTQRKIDTIIVHHSASHDVSASTIHKWHLERGWNGNGYHYVIRKDGSTEPGRDLELIGAHAKGRNAHSIGICLTGYDEFTKEQISALRELLWILFNVFGELSLERHHEACPGPGLKLEELRP